ncbi:hypothetical protein EYF80_012137 [Liparis tanakae]|uniref:Uncharacterized protein n=1 Tax=Liparis tanakae TaxID=230148 RepID=A0A4Z2IIF3_9TELE|nr:hypothetical protein EYF80_012137 [Liparis tanakae]
MDGKILERCSCTVCGGWGRTYVMEELVFSTPTAKGENRAGKTEGWRRNDGGLNFFFFLVGDLEGEPSGVPPCGIRG